MKNEHFIPMNSSQKLLIGFFACMTASSAIAQIDKEARMHIQPYNLWQLLEALGDQLSLSPDKIRLPFPVDFVEKKRNRYFSFHEGGKINLTGQIEIEYFELRTNLADERKGSVVLGLAGSCLSIKKVRAHYHEVIVSDTPRGNSPDEETYYSTQQPWGRISFGFMKRKPECVSHVVINRTADPSCGY